jgi:hypothetical protein
LVQKTWDGDRKGRWVEKLEGRILNDNIEMVPLELKMGKGHIGNIIKELGGDKKHLKGGGGCDLRIQQTCLTNMLMKMM